ncbi:hypothetical protein [Halosimplex halobium]|uniref:hypothetical protein n=1 Tax=Halosimplex halobium TaxID=3396618 RepID=UPI003F56D21A
MCPNHTTSRRKVLGYIGAGAVGLTGAQTVSGKNERGKRIVAVRGGKSNDALVTESVPGRWYGHETALERVYENALAPHVDGEYVLGGGLIQSDRTVDGFSCMKAAFEIDENAPQSVRDDLPEKLSDTNVSVPAAVLNEDIGQYERNHEIGPGGCYADYTDSPFPGGLMVYGGNNPRGTAGFRMWHTDKNKEFLYTANHVLAPNVDCSKSGEGIEVTDTDGDKIGVGSSIYHKGHDWILVDPSTDLDDQIVTREYTSFDSSKDDPQRTVNGYVSDDGLKTIQSNSKLVEQFGITSGRTTGTVTERGKYISENCLKTNWTGIKTSTTFAEGDSGGPCWIDWDGNLSVIAVNNWLPYESKTTNCGGDTVRKGSYMLTYPVWRVVNNNPVTVGDGEKNP